MMTVRSSPFSPASRSWLKKAGHWLSRYRPRLGDWHFWAVQGLVIAIAGVHDFIEASGYLPSLGMLYFVPCSLFFVPVVYAALNFGFAGSISTALWVVIITVPNWLFWHSGLERWGEMFQIAVVVAVAVIVGQRVDRESSARRRAEAAGATLKAYAAHVLRAQEEERQRIARELHDETIQSLALLCRRLDSVGSTGGPLSQSIIEELRQARKTAEEVVKDLRGFTKALRPPILDDLGIATAIRRLVLDCSERSGIKAQLKTVGEEQRLPSEVEIGIFRIAQEALWNVERHSKATAMVVAVTLVEDEAKLNVKDNGIGFNVPPVFGVLSVSGQLGLLGMQERAELLGGAFTIESEPGKGTTVNVAIPLRKDASRVSAVL